MPAERATVPPAAAKRLVSIPAAANQLDLTAKGLRAMLARREIRSVKVGRLRKVPVEAIDEFIRKNTVSAIDAE